MEFDLIFDYLLLIIAIKKGPTVRQLSNDRAMNNNYERQLLISAPADGYDTSMGDSSTPRLLSSTYATPASNGAKFVRTSSSIRNRDSNKTNSGKNRIISRITPRVVESAILC